MQNFLITVKLLYSKPELIFIDQEDDDEANVFVEDVNNMANIVENLKEKLPSRYF
ncbi:hypothetical protein [Thermoplasma volcanium]|uniref:hypothetical protein n=1 Tax=Thermoplasma volcanium TaxID=50339 RepID=UPI0012EABFBB|nr:hypothetical protein [Thermoplasma volcanium]